MTAIPTIFPPRAEISFKHSRSGGPGGQNVNKVNSRVTLFWNVKHSKWIPESARARFIELFSNQISNEGEIVISSSESRSQLRNTEIVCEKLQQMLNRAWKKPKKRKKSAIPRSLVERRLKKKKLAGEKKRLRKLVRD